MGLFAKFLAAALAAALLASCASVSVDDLHYSEGTPTAPEEILLEPFEVVEGALRVDRAPKDLPEFKKQLAVRMTQELTRRLEKHVAPARELEAGEKPPRGNFWLVRGKFLRVNQGSRFLRATLGLGAGGTKMETSVSVFDLSGKEPRRLVSFDTTGGSNVTQGIGGVAAFPVSGPMALTSAAHMLDGVRSGISFDTSRTAKEITAVLNDYLHQHGAIKDKPRLKPKKLAGIPLPAAGSASAAGTAQ